MKHYFVLAHNGFGNDPSLLGAAHTAFPGLSRGNWYNEETTKEKIEEYEKHNGPIKWFDCEHCLASFQSASFLPVNCGNCGRDN